MKVTEEHIRQSNLIEGIDSESQDKLSIKAWKWLEKQDKITINKLLSLHWHITKEQLQGRDCGHFRECGVIVGGRVCPDYQLVPLMIQNWLVDFEELNNPIQAHIDFEHIHPFRDGNGRTGRMLLWWHQIKLGQEPTLFTADNRQDYYKLFYGGK